MAGLESEWVRDEVWVGAGALRESRPFCLSFEP